MVRRSSNGVRNAISTTIAMQYWDDERKKWAKKDILVSNFLGFSLRLELLSTLIILVAIMAKRKRKK